MENALNQKAVFFAFLRTKAEWTWFCISVFRLQHGRIYQHVAITRRSPIGPEYWPQAKRQQRTETCIRTQRARLSPPKLAGHPSWGNSKGEGAPRSKLDQAMQATGQTVCVGLGTLASPRHERMHAEGASNVVEKARSRRESLEGISRYRKLVDRKLWGTSGRFRRGNPIHAILRMPVELRTWVWGANIELQH